MSQEQWKRLDVLRRLEAGALSRSQAAQVLGLTKRQVRRLVRAFEREGRRALVHGNLRREPANKLPARTRERIAALQAGKYAGVSGQSYPVSTHAVPVGGLQAATVYNFRPFSVSGPDTSWATLLVASTVSPPQATGAINAYFNKSVNTALAWYRPAAGNQYLSSRLLARLNAARRSVDVAVYSLSGSPGDEIAIER